MCLNLPKKTEKVYRTRNFHIRQIILVQICLNFLKNTLEVQKVTPGNVYYTLDKPNFWIKRLNSKPNGLSIDLNHKWAELIEKVENGSPLEQDLTKCLMKKYSRYPLWHQSEQDGMTPMHIAASYGLIDVVKFIASYDINPNAPKVNGWTPIHAAAQHGK